LTNEPTVLVTARNFDAAAVALLRAAGCVVRQPELGGRDPAGEALPGLLEGVDAWIVGTTEIGHALLEAHPRLRVIARRGVGYERIDIDAAHGLGRVVAIAAGGNGPSVADHAVGLMLAVCKQLVTLTEHVRRGDWTVPTGLELHEKTVGIVGLGRVGRLVARRLRGFDATILATDIAPDEAFAARHGVRFVELETLLQTSDVVTLHAPLTAATRHMIGAGALASMKPGAILINTARGGLVDEPALAEALRSGHLAGAGLDVFWAETDPGARPAAEALAGLPTVVATPHTAAATKEGLVRSNRIAAETVAMLLAGVMPPADRIVTDGRRAF
jgi:D-3-phosphoglycerate dehydrogenase